MKIFGWVVIGGLNGFFGFYVILFGIDQGSSTTNSWLLSFLISFIQDPLMNIPLLVLFYYVYMPLLIKQKVSAR